ncbi:Bug family tripartite tricarboxylate transporter substrate binding protein [Oceaniglobus trochenteri]|uniref:Bug family tripartite tricarboxylate transporter substrate binding protein n=1 Tax=Oceaniglobus trochenteri TaxID=2763260 RepID=UPI001CFFD867|nr:tripartite tricarboxylate transporter substrate-binding protein [Oceaniglobus trochenteri]
MRIVFAAACAVGMFAGGAALAQNAITDPECIAPAQPGGGFDLTCRVAQDGFSEVLSEPMKVSFLPGGSGAVAINQFNTTRTDDPNAIVAFSTGSLLNIVTGKFGEWTENDVRFVGTVGADFGAVVVRADSEWQNLDDLVATLKEDPTSVIFGSGGSVGSQDWMKGAILLDTVGLDAKTIRYVAFDGGGEAIAALLGGNTDVFFADMGEMTAHMDTGEMRILASLSPERLPAPFEEIPTAIEQGYDAEYTIMRGFYVGKNVSDEAYQEWIDVFRSAYENDHFNKVVAEKGLLKMQMAGDELNASIADRVDRLRGMAQRAGLIQ